MTGRVAMASNHGQMGRPTRVSIVTALRAAEVASCGEMARSMTVILLIMTCRARERISGAMVAHSLVTGRRIEWKALAYSHGQMVEPMKASTKMTSSKEKELSSGLMVDVGWDSGTLENSTAKVPTQQVAA